MLQEKPLCPVFGSCGGCQYQDIDYAVELSLKEALVRKLLHDVSGVTPGIFLPIVASPKVYQYRNRLDLKLKKVKDGSVHIGFSAVDSATVLEIEACPIAMPALSDFIGTLRKKAVEVLPKDYRMANLTIRCGERGNVLWGGIGAHSKRLQEGDYFTTTQNGVTVYFSLDTFFQANLSILPKLCEALRAMPIWSKEAVFFDLYGGVGLFSFCVHDLVRRTVNIEENARAVEVAKHTITVNRLANVLAFSGRVEDILPRILAQNIAGEHVVMVDPPRAGLSADSLKLLNGLTQVRHLVYLSCHPESLALNLKDLSEHWQIVSVQPFDLFPRTRHVETLVLLSRKL